MAQTVRDVMTESLVTLPGVRRLPVVEGGRPVGIVSVTEGNS